MDSYRLRFVRLRLNSVLAVQLSLVFYECTATRYHNKSFTYKAAAAWFKLTFHHHLEVMNLSYCRSIVYAQTVALQFK